MTDIHSMKLHHLLQVDVSTIVMRVPGGWIYRYETYDPSGAFPDGHTYVTSQVFVPYCNEFKKSAFQED